LETAVNFLINRPISHYLKARYFDLYKHVDVGLRASHVTPFTSVESQTDSSLRHVRRTEPIKAQCSLQAEFV